MASSSAAVGSARRNWADQDESSDEEEPVVLPTPVAKQSEQPVRSEPEQRTQQRDYDNKRGQRRDDRPQRAPRERITKAPAQGPFKAFVANLSFKTTEDDVKQFFVGGDCEVTNVVLRTDRNTQRFDGSAIVTFQTAASLEKSMGAEGADFMGRNIHIRVYEEMNGGNRRTNSGGNYGRGEGDSRGAPRDNQHRDQNDGGRYGGRGGGRGDRDGGRGGRGDRGDRPARREENTGGEGGAWSRREAPAAAASPAAAPATAPENTGPTTVGGIVFGGSRTKLAIQPRTKPLEAVAAPLTANSSIFGEGKARVEPAPVAESSKSEESAGAAEDAVAAPEAATAAASEEAPVKKVEPYKAARGARTDAGGKKDGRSDKAPVSVFGKAVKDATKQGRSGKPSGSSARAAVPELTAEEKFSAAQQKQRNLEAGLKEKEKAAAQRQVKNGFAALGDSDDEEEN